MGLRAIVSPVNFFVIVKTVRVLCIINRRTKSGLFNDGERPFVGGILIGKRTVEYGVVGQMWLMSLSQIGVKPRDLLRDLQLFGALLLLHCPRF